MAGNPVNKEQWVLVRTLWESDPVITFAEIAEQLGVTRQCVRQRSVKDKWQKRLDMGVIEAKAHAVADSKVTENSREGGSQALPVYMTPEKLTDRPAHNRELPVIPEGSSPEQAGQIAEDAAVAKRAAVIERQRVEWNHVRKLTYDAIRLAGKKGALESARYAKTVSEAMKLVQEGERRAWGMETEGGNGGGKTPPAATIIVHQQQGVKIG